MCVYGGLNHQLRFKSHSPSEPAIKRIDRIFFLVLCFCLHSLHCNEFQSQYYPSLKTSTMAYSVNLNIHHKVAVIVSEMIHSIINTLKSQIEEERLPGLFRIESHYSRGGHKNQQ